MSQNNMNIFQDTMEILEKGYYITDGKKIKLKLSRRQMEHASVYLPHDIEKISESKEISHTIVMGRIGVDCVNMDSFSLAVERCRECSYLLKGKGENRILVLNLANPVNPGGGVRRGAKAQEEDLCRRSSLLLSLEGREAWAYYSYNRNLHTYMGSDGIIITPDVEILKDENGNLLEDSVIVSVMTCAAPMVRRGLEGMSDEEYREMVYKRITGMLKTAAYLGYKVLVLGAFGCGAFGNDARVVSDLFYKAIKEFDYDGMSAVDFFRRIDFAVLDHSPDQYNFRQFFRNFSHFYREEDEKENQAVQARIRETEKHLDAVRGCMAGGAAGDALGYAVEFWREKRIFDTYGPEGITEYETDSRSGKALISDDTQMTLFTANGLLAGATRGRMRGIAGPPREYVKSAYYDWLKTQQSTMREVNRHERYTEEGGVSWLLDVPELYSRRAPGNTCLDALTAKNDNRKDYIRNPANNSKGCGGIMRVAPLALLYRPGEKYSGGLRELDLEGAQLAAITHGHSLGYMPAAAVTHIISRILTDENPDLKEIVLDARDMMEQLFAGDRHQEELIRIMNLAVELSENAADDLENIHALGEGWVAEETLGISLYCALRYKDDFSAGIIASVNHKGDSDSTGAVTGNILGALLGYSAMEEKWKENLELKDVILEMADDLCHGCQMREYSYYYDPAWECKYIKMHRFVPET